VSYYTNRYNFWNDNKQKIALIDSKFSSYGEFENSFFKNETNFYTFFNLMRDQFNFGQDLKDLYSIFACDFEWAKKTVYCGGSGVVTTPNPAPNPAPTTSVFGCLLKDSDLKFVKSHNYMRYDYVDKDTKTPNYWAFFSNNRFYGSLSKKNGSWSCDGTDAYIIKIDGGNIYSSKTDEWTAPTIGNTTTPSKGNTTTITNTTLTADDLVKGGLVKLGMKGDIVGKIQELLISKGHKDISRDGKVDKIFGRRTKKMVKDFQSANDLNDDGVVGPLTWGKLSDPSLTTAQSDAAKSQLPVNHGKREIDDGGNPFVYDGYAKNWIPDSEYLKLYNTDGTKKLQENIIKNIVGKNLHSLL
jgi:hypothetical protein